jgi:preprotein translocase subunit YajC
VSVPGVIGLQAAAPAATSGAPPAWLQIVPYLLIFLIFYLLWIRPQSRQQREKESQLKGIEKGDLVVTSGGIHGRVVGVTDDVLQVEIAERVKVKLDRARVDRVEKAKKGGAT